MKPLWIAFICLAQCAVLPLIGQHAWPPVGEVAVDYLLNDRTTPKPDGLHYRTYDNSKLYYSGEFLDGKPKPGSHFWWYDYDIDGLLKEQHIIGNDPSRIEGIMFNSDGVKSAQGQYINRQKTGVWQFWDEQGRLRSSQEFEADLPHGTCITYYTSGQILKEETYQSGVQHGPFVEYHKRGKKKAEGSFKYGQYDGPFELYLESGASEVRGRYVEGLKDGSWIMFNNDGTMQVVTNFKLGEKVSEQRQNGGFLDYFESGIPSDSLCYENGVLNGPFIEYHEKGEWIREPMDPNAQGIPLEFRERLVGRQVKREGDYMDGKLEGEVHVYSEDGRLMRIEHYVKGELVETEEH